MRSFSDQLSHGASRTQVAAQMLASGEYRQNVAEGFYEQYLFRTGRDRRASSSGCHFASASSSAPTRTGNRCWLGFRRARNTAPQIEHPSAFNALKRCASLAVPESTNQIVATKVHHLSLQHAGTPDELGLFKVDFQGRIGTS